MAPSRPKGRTRLTKRNSAPAAPSYPLTTPVTALPRVGPAIAARLARLGIRTVQDLLFHWPRTWLDLTAPTPVAALVGGSVGVVEGELSELVFTPAIAKRRARVTGVITDVAGDRLPVVWHNQSFLRRVLANGQRWLCTGPIRWNFQQNVWELSNPQRATERAVLPIYPETAGITSSFLRGLVAEVLPHIALPNAVDELRPDTVSLPFLAAVRAVHQPVSVAAARAARQRLALDELVFVQHQLLGQRTEGAATGAVPVPPSVETLRTFVRQLPFELTDDQRRIGWSIANLLDSPAPVRHMVQGDVGTGKTVVGLLAVLSALAAGRSVYWMVPTQLLARQLAERIPKLLGISRFPVVLVTARDRPAAVAGGTLYVGTHALLTLPGDPAVVIVDEQHRFGVEQQRRLARSGSHLLTMTATPIPRTLLLALYDERTFSQLRMRPSMQQPVQTTVLRATERSLAAATLGAAVARGEQGFVIVPRIEAGEGERGPTPSLAETRTAYQSLLPGVRFSAYHGQLDPAEQERIMAAYLAREIDVLVATSVVEVGLDVPNATTMVIEQADWFGLAQLHQLRGRVGRGALAGTCIVLHGQDAAPERLTALARSLDGFALAELDLTIRGPGDLLGELQAGWGRLKLADVTDLALVRQSRDLASQLAADTSASQAAWRALYQYLRDPDDTSA